MRRPSLIYGLALSIGLLASGCDAQLPADAARTTPQVASGPYPALSGRVVDAANLLPPEDEARLVAQLEALEKDTTDQMVIVTIVSLAGKPIEEFGLALGNRWGVGQRGKNNGVLMIVAPTERKVRLEIGHGLETTLTNDYCAQIIQLQMLPRFRAGDMVGAISAGTDAVVQRLTRKAEIQVRQEAA